MKFVKRIILCLIVSHAFSFRVNAAVDPIVYVQGNNASSIYDGIDFYGLTPSNSDYLNQYQYFAQIVTEVGNSTVPANAAIAYEWTIIGGVLTSANNVSIVTVKWNNTKNYNNGTPTKSIRLKVTYTWTPEGGIKQTKIISSIRSNGSNEAQPIEVKYIGEPSTISFNGSTLSNNNSLVYACGAEQKTISVPAVITDPNAPVTYYFTYPNGWVGPASSGTPSVTVNTNVNQGGAIKVEVKRNDTNNFRTKISINITRPLPTKPIINSGDILLCSPQTITASASNATSYNWSTTGGITANSPGNTNSAQITGVSDGTVKVSATSSVCAMTTAFSNPINVKRSAPKPESLLVTANGGNPPDFMCNGSGVMLNAYTAEPGTVFGNWSTSDPGNTFLNFNGGSAYFNSYVNSCYGIDIVVSNCFGAVQKGITICVDNCAKPTIVYKIFPNPATDYLNVTFEEVGDVADLPVALSLYSESDQKEVKMLNPKSVYESGAFAMDKTISMPVKDLKRGIYFLHIGYKEGQVEKHRIILK
jgi:hypothetical protein